MKLIAEKQRLVDLICKQRTEPLHPDFHRQLSDYVKDATP